MVTMPSTKDIDAYMTTLTDTLSLIDRASIMAMMKEILSAYHEGGTIYICGNGGSGATASHIVCDFNKGASLNLDQKFNFVCLNDNIATILAISNDIGYEKLFLIQAEGRIREGDILIAISGSGNSSNVIRVVEYFKSQGNTVIGLSGYSGGKLRELSDISVHVPINDMQKVEDSHMIVLHLCAQIISKELGNPLC